MEPNRNSDWGFLSRLAIVLLICCLLSEHLADLQVLLRGLGSTTVAGSSQHSEGKGQREAELHGDGIRSSRAGVKTGYGLRGEPQTDDIYTQLSIAFITANTIVLETVSRYPPTLTWAVSSCVLSSEENATSCVPVFALGHTGIYYTTLCLTNDLISNLQKELGGSAGWCNRSGFSILR